MALLLLVGVSAGMRGREFCLLRSGDGGAPGAAHRPGVVVVVLDLDVLDIGGTTSAGAHCRRFDDKQPSRDVSFAGQPVLEVEQL